MKTLFGPDLAPGGFSDVDRTHNPDAFVRYLKESDDVPFRQWEMRHLFDGLRAARGQSILDVGCGLGTALIELCKRVPGIARAVGVDRSETMIREARSRSADIAFFVADAEHLPFADATFDGCMAGRLLQHVDDPGAVLTEMVRVVRPGGRVAVVDTDWNTVESNDPALASRIKTTMFDAVRSGRAVSQIASMLRMLGVADVRVVAQSSPLTGDASVSGITFSGIVQEKNK